MKKVTRRVVWLGFLLLVVAALTAVTALNVTTPIRRLPTTDNNR